MVLENNATPKEGNMIECGGGDDSGNSGAGEANELKKGLWTPEEDAILTKFVMENGERNWNDVRRNFGLMRCGQSCRRRWFNNLRSNLKKGDFTLEEECKILRLHARYGNRWSLIALHLPGRSDNEIKNYWNIRLRRHIRAGLPIYPPRILREMLTRHLQHQQQEQIPQNHIHIFSLASPDKINLNYGSIPSSLLSKNEQNPNFSFIPSSSSSSHQTNIASSSSSSSSNQEIPNFIPTDSNHMLLIDSICHLENIIELDLHNNVATMPPPSPPPLPVTMKVLSSNLPFIPHFDQTQIAQYDMNPLPKINDDFFSENFEMEIPSIQSSFLETTPSSSSSSIVVPSNGEDNFNMAQEYCSHRNNNGLLEDILRQSLYSSRLPSNEDEQSKVDQPAAEGRIMHDNPITTIPSLNNVNLESGSGLSCNLETPLDEWSSMNTAEKSHGHVFEDLSLMVDDDSWSWLDFPTTGPTELAKVSNGTMATTTPVETNHDWAAEVEFSPVATIPADADLDWAQQIMADSPIPFTPFEQDHEWVFDYVPS